MVDHPLLRSDELTELLTISADESWDVGQEYWPSPTSPKQRYRFSRWAVRAAVATLNDLPIAIRELMNRIQGKEQRFLLLPCDATVSLTLFITETDTVASMGLESGLIRFLAKINARIEISLITVVDPASPQLLC